MVKRMLIDATHAEESRVVVINGNRLEEYDVETSTKKQIKGNIYLAKVTRVEPSLQAAFVDYGGNRHGFLAFSEIHSDYYQIPVADREAFAQQSNTQVKDAEIVEDNIGDSEDSPKKEKKPSRSRSRRKPRAQSNDDASDTSDAEAPEADASTEAPAQSDAASENTGSGEEEEAKPRRRRPRNRRKKSDDVEASGSDAEATQSSDSSDNSSSDGDDTPTGGNAAMSAEIAELEVDVDDANEVTALDATADVEEDIEDMGGDDDGDEFVESHSRQLQKRYKIQEVIKRRQIILVQVVKEERGNKGAALSTFLSLAGRYCVLMPNTPRGGGISRKITNAKDRKRLKSILAELEIPDGMAVIVRTAGSERTKAEIKRDFDYLMRLWDRIRETTLQSQAPCLIYEEADLIKRSIRDLYARDVDEVLVEGDDGYRVAKDFMKMLMPSHAKRVQPYKDQGVPLFHRFQVESQLDAMLNPVVQLKSGGYLVINPTEALVAVDVNSGRSTRERNIEETAYKTNLEAAEELARQLRLRDLAGLIVVDFIDMEDHRNQASVERKLKEAMRNDRARLQIGRISPFGLLEMSRQRLRPSLVESAFEVCTHCRGVGLVRSIESAALHLLRVIEEEGMRRRSGALTVHVASEVALYILNRKRDSLGEIESRYGFSVMIFGDDSLISPDHRIERTRAKKGDEVEEVSAVLNTDSVSLTAIENPVDADDEEDEIERNEDDDQGGKRRRRRRRRRGRNDDRDDRNTGQQQEASDDNYDAADNTDRNNNEDDDDESNRKRRRRGKRGGRRRSRRQDFDANRTRSPADDPALTAARRSRDHEAPDGADETTVVDADSEGQDADSFDQEGVRAGRTRSTTAPAPARPRRDRNDNRRNRRDRNSRSDRNDGDEDRGDVKNIPIQSGPAPEAKPEAEAAPASAPAEVSAPAPKQEAPKAEAPVEKAAEKPAEPKAAEPAKVEKPEPKPAPAPAPEAAPAAEPAKDEKPKPKKRGWWSLGR
jgi:ribonuclease E